MYKLDCLATSVTQLLTKCHLSINVPEIISHRANTSLVILVMLFLNVVSNLQWLHKDSHLLLSIFKNSI